MANANLIAAKAAKVDEYYTVWADIEREMNAYLEYDQDVFRGKTILLPCDDQIVHGYWSVDLEILHTTARHDLPAFTAELKAVSADLES